MDKNKNNYALYRTNRQKEFPMKKKIKLRKIPLKRITATLSQKTFSAYAAQTAFFLMLSFFPFLIFCFALLRNTPLTEDMFIRFL